MNSSRSSPTTGSATRSNFLNNPSAFSRSSVGESIVLGMQRNDLYAMQVGDTRHADVGQITGKHHIGLLAAQGQEFAHVLRNGADGSLSVFGPRPVDLAAKKLVDEFGVAINVEDPLYFYRDDVQFSHVAASGKRAISKEQAKRLGARFSFSPAVFI